MILDQISTEPYAAYSVRRLRENYTGPCMRIQRVSDGVEEDFGFVADLLDTAAIATFLGASLGYCAVFYDQSRNGRSAGNAAVGQYPRYRAIGGPANLPCLAYREAVSGTGTCGWAKLLPLGTEPNPGIGAGAFDLFAVYQKKVGAATLGRQTGWNLDAALCSKRGINEPNLETTAGFVQFTPLNVENKDYGVNIYRDAGGTSRAIINNVTSAVTSALVYVVPTVSSIGLGGAYPTAASSASDYSSEYFLFNRALADGDRTYLNQDITNYYGLTP